MPVEFEIEVAENWTTLIETPPDECTDPGEQFSNGEWFREIVVRPCVESLDAVLHKTPGCQHKDRHIGLGIAQLAANMDAAQTWKANIQENAVIRGRSRHLE